MGRKRIHPPDDLYEILPQIAKDHPTIPDIAATLGYSDHVFDRWRKESKGRIDRIIGNARANKTRKITEKVESKALDGDLKAAGMWMRWFRPDLEPRGGSAALLQFNQTNIHLEIIPPEKPLHDWVIEHDAEQVIEHHRNILEKVPDPALPLFRGKPAHA